MSSGRPRCALVKVALGISPACRQHWLLENVLVIIAVPALVLAWRDLCFSNTAYACLFGFFLLHEVGAHYTYSEVPYDAWLVALTGYSLDAALGFERNQYDRLVHFMYGVLLMPATVGLFRATASPRGVWTVRMPVFFIMSHSVPYEIGEWLAAEVFGGDLGQAYLGTQGDIRDVQEGMALATAGALAARLCLLTVPRWRRHPPD